ILAAHGSTARVLELPVRPPPIPVLSLFPYTTLFRSALLLSPAATRSLLTTPPVTLVNDHVAGTLATKLENASSWIANAVKLEPEFRSGHPSAPVVLSAATPVSRTESQPVVTVNLPER